MKAVRCDGRRGGQPIFGDDLGGESQILLRGGGLVLQIDARRVDAHFRQRVPDAGGLGDGLAVVLPAGGHAHRLRVSGQIVIGGLYAASQHQAGVAVREHLAAQHHHGAGCAVRGTLGGGLGHFPQRHQHHRQTHRRQTAHQPAQPFGPQQTAEERRPQQHRRGQQQHRRRPHHAEVQDARRQRQQEEYSAQQAYHRRGAAQSFAHVSSP